MFANLMEKKIVMTKPEAAKAGKMGTDKYNELAALMERFPNFEIIVVKTNTKSADHLKGLTYEYMESYIKSHNEALLAEFYEFCGKDENGKKIERGIRLSYGEVRMWFLEQFPEIENFDARKSLDKKMDEIRKARAARKAA